MMTGKVALPDLAAFAEYAAWRRYAWDASKHAGSKKQKPRK